MRYTKAEFDSFEAEINRLMDKWHLGDQDLRVVHGATTDDAIGECSCSEGGTVITLKKKPFRAEFKVDVLRLARHEFMHALLFRFSDVSSRRYVTSDNVLDEEERLCRMAEGGLE